MKVNRKMKDEIMRGLLVIFTTVFALVGCNGNQKKDLNDTVKFESNTSEKVKVKEDASLNIVDMYQDITLRQRGDECGEWGGNSTEIRIYKNIQTQLILADYKKTIIDCKAPYKDSDIKEINAIALDKAELKLIEESIAQLTDHKLSTKQEIAHSGISNSVVSRDSSLIIEHWPSFKWSKFRELIKTLEEK